MLRTNSDRLKRIQTTLGVEADGELGPQTLAAIEKRLRIPDRPAATAITAISSKLTLTRSGVEEIIAYEISSKAYYRAKLTRPTWPGGDSGVTIGIGYDLGYASVEQFERHWGPLLSATDRLRLARACGKKGQSAKNLIPRLSSVQVSYEAAQEVFMQSSIPQYAAKTLSAFAGVEALEPDAQVALLSLVYNRGTSMKGSSRAEMKAIQALVKRKDYAGIARKIRQMKRLWEGRGLDGLLKRRDHEADLVANCEREYQPSKLVRV